jgi:hypothetical protein
LAHERGKVVEDTGYHHRRRGFSSDRGHRGVSGSAWVVRLSLSQAHELKATVERAYLIPEEQEADHLVDFFEAIANLHWSGWEDVKTWSSLEGNLSLRATWHKTGSATLQASLNPEGQLWRAEGTIELDNIALERVGPEARSALLGS